MKKRAFLFVMSSIMFGCTKEADIKLPEQEEKLVVTCFIGPSDTVHTAYVGTSKPEYNVGHPYNYSRGVPDAKLIISSAEGSATFTYEPSTACYLLSANAFPILPGASYSISVTTPDGKQTKASTVVPVDTLPIRSFDLNMSYSSDSTRLEITSTAEIGTIKGRPNYVAMFYRQVQMPDDSSFMDLKYYLHSGHAIFEDDEKRPRESFVHQGRQGSYSGNIKVDVGKLYAEFWAVNCSREFYLYNRSIRLASEVGGNPFGDPVMVYSNMENGFGCFGAYTVSKRSIWR